MVDIDSLDERSSFQKKLLDWFEEYQRPLPWRKKYDPYEVWISEIMLQQTQVSKVLPYYSRWMKKFPTIESVAEASEEDVLKYWEGLGYYTRVKNIHKTAQEVCEVFNGIFPNDFQSILKLRGIGRYTAGAIASIAFNQNYPVVDGNVTRVISRVMNLMDPPNSSNMQKTLWSVAENWIPSEKARWFNQAVMELGATVCLVKNPLCLLCPIQAYCKAYAEGTVNDVPVKVKKNKPISIIKALAVIEWERKFLVRKRSTENLMRGLWEFPNIIVNGKKNIEQQLVDEIQKEWGILVKIQEKIATIKHSYTSYRATLHCYYCHSISFIEYSDNNIRWDVLENIEALAFPSAHGKVRDLFRKKFFAYI